jgi:putative CocE/NonD family hydrolase
MPAFIERNSADARTSVSEPTALSGRGRTQSCRTDAGWNHVVCRCASAGRVNPSPITPGSVYEYTIELWSTSCVCMPGHRVLVDIASANFPRFDRNPNTGHPLFSDAELQIATQTIFHDAAHPSHIVLPVIPR